MWLVNAALRHPYTVWVGMLLTVGLGILSYLRTPTDILPTLKVPVVVVFASYRGMPAPDMEQSVTSILERALTRCDHLEHIESRSLLGISIVQVYFRPNVSGDVASSQVIALVNGEMQNMPPGMLPPSVLNYDASAIPVGNLVVSSQTRDDKYLLDFADFRLREELAGIEGLASAPVFGGVFRQVQIYVDPRALESLNLSPMDVARIVNNQSAVVPTGEMRIDRHNYYVRSNAMLKEPKDFHDIPLYNDGRKVVKLGDVANVVDGTRWRTNVVRVNGRRAVYVPLLRQAGASAVTVVDNVQDSLVDLRRRGAIPDDVEVEVVFDQSVYVRDALSTLEHEALLGSILASLVVLLFLGNLRTTITVALTIPLSVLAALAGLYFVGETLNIMTLGGLALVLGRVVDDAVVDVENTIRHLDMGKTPFQAALDSANEISIPVLMATVTTVIVFLPLVLMSGVGKYLFTPLAISVALAMSASYLASRTFSPLACALLLRTPPPGERQGHIGADRFPRWLFALAGVLIALGVVAWASERLDLAESLLPDVNPRRIGRVASLLEIGGILGVALLASAPVYWFSPRFDRWFSSCTQAYERLLAFSLRHRLLVLLAVGFTGVLAWWSFRHVGQELFPDVDSSEFTLHVRASGGPRVEETERQIEEIEDLIRGKKADAKELADALVFARRHGEDDLIAAARDANPDERGFIDAVLAADNGERTRLVEAAEKEKKFELPGVIPPEDFHLMLSNVGLSSRWSAVYTTNNGPHAAFIRVQLRSGFKGRRKHTVAYVNELRKRLEKRYPTHDFFFETGGMIRRILNNGSIAPLEVQVSCRDHQERRRVTQMLHKQITQLKSVQDANSPQGFDLPMLNVIVDRTRAAQMGLTEVDVVRNVITALMSSAQLAPNFWIDPQSGNPYVIGVQYPEHAVKGVRTLEEIPITGGKVGKEVFGRGDHSPRGSKGPPPVRLADLATIDRGMGPVEVYHYSASRVSQLFVNVRHFDERGRPVAPDLAGTAADVNVIIRHFPLTYALDNLPADKADLAADESFTRRLGKYLRLDSQRRKEARVKAAEREEIRQEYGVDPKTLELPRDLRIEVRGEVEAMRHSFRDLALSLALAVGLVYLVLAAQFASWVDPLIMIVSAPLGLIGVGLMLWATDTTLNVQSMMGVLMMVGISTSNSVLLVEFANRQRHEAGMSVRQAILSASAIRLRPILMTTIATLVGLAPMAIHVQPGDEMNLPLARAVIGGLTTSTLLTLFVVPVLYSLLESRTEQNPENPTSDEGQPIPAVEG